MRAGVPAGERAAVRMIYTGHVTNEMLSQACRQKVEAEAIIKKYWKQVREKAKEEAAAGIAHPKPEDPK